MYAICKGRLLSDQRGSVLSGQGEDYCQVRGGVMSGQEKNTVRSWGE